MGEHVTLRERAVESTPAIRARDLDDVDVGVGGEEPRRVVEALKDVVFAANDGVRRRYPLVELLADIELEQADDRMDRVDREPLEDSDRAELLAILRLEPVLDGERLAHGLDCFDDRGRRGTGSADRTERRRGEHGMMRAARRAFDDAANFVLDDAGQRADRRGRPHEQLLASPDYPISYPRRRTPSQDASTSRSPLANACCGQAISRGGLRSSCGQMRASACARD